MAISHNFSSKFGELYRVKKCLATKKKILIIA
jgi:hypothetical protein